MEQGEVVHVTRIVMHTGLMLGEDVQGFGWHWVVKTSALAQPVCDSAQCVYVAEAETNVIKIHVASRPPCSSNTLHTT